MRMELDIGPLFQNSLGFDRMFEVLRNATRIEHLDSYPPYDIEKLGENEYRLTLAVAGFEADEITVTAQRNLLVVAGEKRDRGRGEGGRLLHRGIATRPFERRFDLADHVEVSGARLAGGLLTIDLRHELPESMRPRRIRIAGGAPHPPRQIEGKAA